MTFNLFSSIKGIMRRYVFPMKAYQRLAKHAHGTPPNSEWQKIESFFTSKSRSKMLPAREAKLQRATLAAKSLTTPCTESNRRPPVVKGH